MKTLIHIHTDYSFDSNITLDALAAFMKRQWFDRVAITDHDTIEGALRMRDNFGECVIVGEEISTRDGHLIGLFLEQGVAPRLSARETAHAIHEQRGLVLVPHPFVRWSGCGLMDGAFEMIELIDAVEVGNAQNLSTVADRRAEQFATEFDLPGFVGADSHSLSSIAPCHQIMPRFAGRDDFLDALRRAELIRGRHPISYFAGTAYRIARYYAGLPLPCGFGASFGQCGTGCLAR